MGVIIPNPTFETEDGATSVSNVKKVEVTNGTLTDDGDRIVSIETGSGGSASGVEFAIQISDGAGGLDSNNSFRFWPEGGQLHLTRAEAGGYTTDIYGGRNESAHGMDLQLHSSNDTSGLRNGIVLGGERNSSPAVQGILLDTATTGDGVWLRNVADDDVYIANTADDSDIVIKPSGSGKVEVLNFDTNTDSTLEVTGNGTGAAKIVMTATSGNGGLTFPDGTEQTTAASGGSGGTDLTVFDPTTLDSGTSESWSTYWPFQPTTQYGQPSNWYAQTQAGESFGYPFIAQSTGAISGITVTVYSGGSDDPGVAIYSADSDGYPKNLQGMGFPASNSTGAKRITAFYETDGTTSTTISLTKGSMYWVMHGGRTGDTDLPMLAAQMSTNSMVPSYGSAYYANGAGYNPRGTVKFTLASGSLDDWTDIYPSTWPTKAAIGTAGGSMGWSNSQSEGATVYFGVDSS